MNIIIENETFRLELAPNCTAQSLICKETGEECLEQNQNISFFSITENRPYNNEIKLAHPNKRTTFNANRIRKEGKRLIVGFELLTFEAVVEITVAPTYVAFTLSEFLIKEDDFLMHHAMTPPPVEEFRLIQLPIKNRNNFGEWLNVMWDEKTAVCVLANSPFARIDSEKRNGFRILTADAVNDIKREDCGAVLTVTSSARFMDSIDAIENDYNLPKGVASRRGDKINASAYWTGDINPQTVDQYIAYAKAAGFTMMLIYYTALFRRTNEIYAGCSDYTYNENYPNGKKDLKKVLEKIKAAGITPGLHILHTHIGKLTKYVTPFADHRLNLTRNFTLARELGCNDTTIFVEENPAGTVMHEKCRILKFGGELIYYESFSTQYPYCFKGCKRGHFDTKIYPHEIGTIGGILHISEYCGNSVYINQNSSLQDEIATEIADTYNAGFEYLYFDGSEGTNSPFEFHIPNAQYRVYKKLEKEPLYCEGAAKSHFSWHMLSGGNAFDTFPMSVFKEKIARYPLEEAPRMAQDFTRVNFGWWTYKNDTMPDIYEYGTSKAASWDCPITLQANPKIFDSNPRTADVFEVMSRWEDVRAKKWLTYEQKLMLRNPNREFILLVNENGEYELTEYFPIVLSDELKESVTAYTFDRLGKTYVVLWHTIGRADISIPLNCNFNYTDRLDSAQLPVRRDENNNIILSVAGRRYFTADAPKDILIKAFKNARVCNE